MHRQGKAGFHSLVSGLAVWFRYGLPRDVRRFGVFGALLVLISCGDRRSPQAQLLTVSRADYAERLHGFWLGQCIANWTGLVTEMDKIGNIGELQTGAFYTREDWGKPDQPSIWGAGMPSDLSPTIDFVLRGPEEAWGADDDTDIEYLYQHLLDSLALTRLSASQIREGWLRHIPAEEENYLWVSNQRAFDLMREGILPPETSLPSRNEHYDMIDAQLTTEIFGLYAPGRPDVALKLADLPIRTTAYGEAADIAGFYVVMYSLAAGGEYSADREGILAMARRARSLLKPSQYPALMFDVVLSSYLSGVPWEQTRDTIYQRYQVDQKDGYTLTSRGLYCNGCFAAGINFAASLVSLFYGEGDFRRTIQIGALAGWDSDNPTATWGGMLGFMYGRKGIEEAFGGRRFANRFHIGRTRQHFTPDGFDDFERMASAGLRITDRVVRDEIRGDIDTLQGSYRIPLPQE